MNKFNNENARKAVHSYGLMLMTGFAFSLIIVIAFMAGMHKLNDIVVLNSFYLEYGNLNKFNLFTRIATTETLIIFFAGIFAITFFVLGIANIVKLDFYFKKHGGKEQIIALENEMNSGSAIWLKKSKTYITENYIISFRNGFTAFRYSDLLWLYECEHSVNGIKTRTSLKALCTNGKTYEVASAPNYKEVKTEFMMILGSAAEKNPDILIGYSNENIAASKNILKQIKYQKYN